VHFESLCQVRLSPGPEVLFGVAPHALPLLQNLIPEIRRDVGGHIDVN